MEDLEKVFLEAVRAGSRSAKGYSLDFVNQSLVSVIEGEPPDVLRIDYVIPESNVGLQFSMAKSIGSFLGLRFSNKNGEFFSLAEYLTKHKKDDILDFLFKHRRDLPTVLKKIILLFNTDLNDIITGKRWEDVPRDWMGYK
jgi:hypothetical protein